MGVGCGLRRTGGPSPGFGAFSSSPYTVPLYVLGLGGRHRGIVELSEDRCVCDLISIHRKTI